MYFDHSGRVVMTINPAGQVITPAGACPCALRKNGDEAPSAFRRPLPWIQPAGSIQTWWQSEPLSLGSKNFLIGIVTGAVAAIVGQAMGDSFYDMRHSKRRR